MQRAYSKVSKEMPHVKKISVTPSTSGTLSKIFTPRGANAVSNPWSGNMIYNPDMMGDMGQFDKEQVIAHEMVHTGQMQDMPWYKKIGEMLFNRGNVPEGIPATSNLNNPYYWRPHELEAYQAERDRATRLKIPNYVDPITGGRDYSLHPKYTPPKVETGPSSTALKKLQTKNGVKK
jgi:hypothetical protein